MSKKMILFAIVCVLGWTVGTSIGAETGSYFRRDSGVAAGIGSLPDGFDSKDQLMWRQRLAPGNSTPCIFGDSIFLTTFREKQQELATLALDRKTGEVQWQRVVPTKEIEPYHQVGSPASCTPACDGERLYAFFGSYGLLCYDLDGNLLWEKRFRPFQDEFGACSSPIVVDGKVILNEDHDINSFLIAIDQRTGDTVWNVAREGSTRSYSTPVVWQVNGKKQIVVAGSLKVIAYDITDGSKIWWVNGLSRIVDTTPAIAQDLLFVATWTPGGDQTERISMEPFSDAVKQYDKNGDGKIAKPELPKDGPVDKRFFRIDLNQDGKLDAREWAKHARVFALSQNVAMAIRPGGRGDVTKTHVKWLHRRGLPVVPSPLVYRGVVYLVKDSGIVTSLGAASGKVLKQGRIQGRGNYYASPVAGDGKVYIVSERGVMTVLRHAQKWEVLSTHDFGERIMATPVIADGKIYVRTDEALYCFGNR